MNNLELDRIDNILGRILSRIDDVFTLLKRLFIEDQSEGYSEITHTSESEVK
jgi:hypothetical protein